jgi:membrane-associated protease RseP (regulator of RpoE activity)
MKSHLTTLFIALIVGYLGGISSQLFHSKSRPDEQIQVKQAAAPSSSFDVQTEPDELVLQIAHLQQRIDWLEMQLNEIVDNQPIITAGTENKTIISTAKNTRPGRTVVPDKDNLVSAGVDPVTADDILRRISQQEFRRLELQNLIQRNTGSDIRQYRDELRALNQNKISLRSELGDDAYDQYLMVSGQNNRMQVSAVMAESPAELNGIQKDDVILYYDDKKIFNWSDLRGATLAGEIDSYTNVVIFRDGMRMSVIVPRGTLGVQLEAIQVDPARER